MLGITDPLTYVLGVIAIVLLPGPNSMYVLSVAARRGVRNGYRGAFGVFLGDSILMVATALGAASALRASPSAFLFFKYLGAAYLAWIGLNMLKNAYFSFKRGAQLVIPSAQQLTTDDPFRRALVISLINPKAILFFLSFFIQFIDPQYPYPALTFFALAAVVQFFSFLYLSTLIFAGARLAQAFAKRRLIAASISGGVGAMFIGFGLKLANASLN